MARKTRAAPKDFYPVHWCHLFLNERPVDFELVPKVHSFLQESRDPIYQSTGAKVSLLEKTSASSTGRPAGKDPPMIAITSNGSAESLIRAVLLVTDGLDKINNEHPDSTILSNSETGPGLSSSSLWRFGEMHRNIEEAMPKSMLPKPSASAS
jgi:hypothetical protein